ncbi:MAG TPA: 2-phospho-L-lactate transferase [Candidatus Limnocylindrales bacterium]|nr:2-phospho-L-lactate transferase [Candidatus Limnocylindrales bacterium]
MSRPTGRVVELAGGVGGARLAHGLQAHLGAALTVVVNTADDLERHGLLVCPDHDTVLYTLAGIEGPFGWGIEDDTSAAMVQLGAYGEATWFGLGDRDLAAHIVRTARIRAGASLTEANLGLQRSLGIGAAILPMSDDPVRTEVLTGDGWLEFQEYFVHRHQEPEVLAVRLRGIEAASLSVPVAEAIEAATAIVLAPSNPIVSIGPILAVDGLTAAIKRAVERGVPVVAVSGIIGGRALKGPADRMLASLGHDSSALGVARLYAGLATGFMIDPVDAGLAPAIEALGLRVLVTDTLMVDDPSRARVAASVLDFAASLAPVRR